MFFSRNALGKFSQSILQMRECLTNVDYLLIMWVLASVPIKTRDVTSSSKRMFISSLGFDAMYWRRSLGIVTTQGEVLLHNSANLLLLGFTPDI